MTTKKRAGRTTRHPGITDLGEGRYRLRARWTCPATGRKRERERMIQAGSMKEALRAKADLEGELREGPVERPLSRVGDVATAWLEEITTRKHPEDPTQVYLCPTTSSRYATTVTGFIVPFLGTGKLAQLTGKRVLEWRNHLVESGYSREYVNDHLRVLKQILRTVGVQVATEVKELNPKATARITRTEPNLLSGPELDRFLAVAKERWPQHYPLILVLFTTTMRLSTALALRRDDLDLERMEFVVVRRLSGGQLIPGVKRDRFGEDSPPLLPEVLIALEAQWSKFNESQLASGLMFPGFDGKHRARTILQKPFKDILEHADISIRFTPHGCRRTGAKLYGRTSGTRIAMDIAGHVTEEMHRHYAPTAADEKQEAAQAAFGHLRVLNGGVSKEERGIRAGDARNEKSRLES